MHFDANRQNHRPTATPFGPAAIDHDPRACRSTPRYYFALRTATPIVTLRRRESKRKLQGIDHGPRACRRDPLTYDHSIMIHMKRMFGL